MFRENLQRTLNRLPGAVAGILMGFDGISVESYTKEGVGEIDIQVVGMELAHTLLQMQKAMGRLECGGLSEVVLKAEKLTVVVFVLNAEYFLACAVLPSANLGRARHLVRLLAPQIQADL